MFLSQLNFLHWCKPFHLMVKMVGTNGKVGPDPRLVSIEYTFKSDG
jgi:hypothetical protein